jgi:predicted kinase
VSDVRLEVTFGVPASGKSTWCELAASGEVVTADDVRLLGAPGQAVLQRALRTAVDLLELGGRVTVDACSMNPVTRQLWVRTAAELGVRARLVTFAVEADEALRRNARRPAGERVPWPLLYAYLRSYDEQLALTAGEGWAEVVSGDELRTPAGEW